MVTLYSRGYKRTLYRWADSNVNIQKGKRKNIALPTEKMFIHDHLLLSIWLT